MHIAVVGPVQLPQLAAYLRATDAAIASEQPGSQASGPTRVVTALLDRGHRVTVVTHHKGLDGLRLAGELLDVVRVTSTQGRWARTASRWSRVRTDMTRAVVASGAEVVHSNWTYEAALAAAASGLAHVNTVRDAPLTVVRYMPSGMRLVRLSLAAQFRLTDRGALLTAPSPYMAQRWRMQMLDRRSVAVIPNIAPAPPAPAEQSEPGRSPRVVAVGDDSPRKNILNVLRAFGRVVAEVPDATLSVIGPGLGPESPIARRAHELGLAGNVTFHGACARDDVQRAMSQARVVVQGSLEESFGNVLVEAMALARPVVAGACAGATAWVLGHQAAGVLVDVRDPDAIATALVGLLGDPEECRRLGARGRQRVVERFAEEAVVDAFLETYRRAVDGGSSRRRSR